jgi:hypothetical protein
MLQIHPHTQLAHWAVVTLTTVEDRCDKDQAPHEASLIVAFRTRLFLEKKNHLTKP